MWKIFVQSQRKACDAAGIRCTWYVPDIGPKRLPPTQEEIVNCFNVCDPIRRKFWKAQEQAEHDLLKKNIQVELSECTTMVDPIKEKLAKHRNDLYFWITVTPGELPFGSNNKPKDLGDFAMFIDKFINRQCVKSGIACLEQKRTCKEDMRPLHPHAHILVRRRLSCPPSTLRKNTFSTFKKLYRKPPTKQTLQIIPCPHLFVKDKLQYISSGGKTGEGKACVQKEDIRWREENGFPEYWINGNIAPE